MILTGKENTRVNAPGVVLFDGWCNLCGALVGFLLRHDRQGRLLFVALQDSSAGEYLQLCNLQPDYSGGLVLVEQDGCRVKSDAVLGILRLLGPPWSLLRVLRVIPGRLRDRVYDLIAATRYPVFGRRTCIRRPSPEERDRFIPPEDPCDRG